MLANNLTLDEEEEVQSELRELQAEAVSFSDSGIFHYSDFILADARIGAAKATPGCAERRACRGSTSRSRFACSTREGKSRFSGIAYCITVLYICKLSSL